jgi:hypothetical protein
MENVEMSHDEYDLLRTLLLHLKEREPLPWQDWMEGFLRDLERNGGNVSIAIDLCEVSRDTVYKYRRRNQQFARRWEAIIEAVPVEKRAPRQRARRRLDAADRRSARAVTARNEPLEVARACVMRAAGANELLEAQHERNE